MDMINDLKSKEGFVQLLHVTASLQRGTNDLAYAAPQDSTSIASSSLRTKPYGVYVPSEFSNGYSSRKSGSSPFPARFLYVHEAPDTLHDTQFSLWLDYTWFQSGIASPIATAISQINIPISRLLTLIIIRCVMLVCAPTHPPPSG